MTTVTGLDYNASGVARPYPPLL